MVTARGLIKKTCASEFIAIRNNGKKALLLRPGDRLKHVEMVRKGDGILIGSIDGTLIHFDSDSIRPQSRAASGVKAMKFKPAKEDSLKTLGEDEEDTQDALPANVAGMAVVPSRFVKQLELDKGSSEKDMTEEDDSEPAEAPQVNDDAINDEGASNVTTGPCLMFLSASGKGKRISLANFKQQTRAGRGKRAMGLAKGDAVAAMCVTGFDGEKRCGAFPFTTFRLPDSHTRLTLFVFNTQGKRHRGFAKRNHEPVRRGQVRLFLFIFDSANSLDARAYRFYTSASNRGPRCAQQHELTTRPT
jgi:DNA gyrase subunit A|tara:strand:- start:162 stop:1070 length:909 start_codon:yes stop_codon:yes gene_type:complete